MKKRRITLLILFISIIGSLFVGRNNAMAEEKDYSYQELWGGGCSITGYSGTDKDITIPSTLNGIEVKAIDNNAFNSNESITSVKIPYGVTSIGDSAFSSCASLVGITIPKSVTSIGKSAFEKCNGLSKIIIPYGVKSIKESTFYRCISLQDITIPKSVKSIGREAFKECSLLEKISIPNGVEDIGDCAFSDCMMLNNVTIPKSVRLIGNGAFLSCRSLSSISIPNGVVGIEPDTFQYCSGLTSVTLPSSVTYIDQEAFQNCEKLVEITLPCYLGRIGDEAFANCNALSSITLPRSLQSIGKKAFYTDPSLEEVYIDGDIPFTIGESAFEGCSANLIFFYPSSKLCNPALTNTFELSSCPVKCNSFKNGAIYVSTFEGMSGEKISLDINPEDGYTLKANTLTYNGQPITSTSFIMPDVVEVTISAAFEKIPVPEVTVNEGSTTFDPTPTWNWTDTTKEGYYRYRMNNSNPWNYTVSTSYTPAADLATGNYTLEVQEMDNNGCWSNSGSASVSVTVEAPPVVSLIAPTGTNIQVKNSKLILGFDKTVTAAAGGIITIQDGKGSADDFYTCTITTNDSFISVTDSNCKAEIPISRFINGLGSSLETNCQYLKKYYVSVDKSAFINKSGKGNLYTDLGEFTTGEKPDIPTVSSDSITLKNGCNKIFDVEMGSGAYEATKVSIKVGDDSIIKVSKDEVLGNYSYLISANACGKTQITVSFNDSAATVINIPVTVLDAPVTRTVTATRTNLVLTFDRTVTSVPDKAIIINDCSNFFYYQIKAADQYISGEGTNCKMTIPFTKFVDSTGAVFKAEDNKEYSAGGEEGAFIDGIGNTNGPIILYGFKIGAEPPISACPASYYGVQKRTTNGTKDIRLIAVIKTLDADEVGFVYSESDKEPAIGKALCTPLSTKKVYSSIKANGGTKKAEDLGGPGAYYILGTVKDIMKFQSDTLYIRVYVKKGDVVSYTDVKTLTLSNLK